MTKNIKQMKLNNDSSIIEIELENGNKVNADILFTFNENGDQFILYEINDIAYGAKINDDNSLKQLEEDEWELVEKIFNEWQEEQMEKEEENK